MKRIILGKSFLVSGFLLFSVLVLGQSTWACETPDYNDYQCYGQLDIKRVRLDYDKDLIHILGKNFKNGGYPYVTLGDLDLHVEWYNDNELVTTFPGVEEGQYKLVISTGDGYKCKDKYSVKIDRDNKPSCPPTPPPPTCPELCPQGEKGDKGDKGDKGEKGDTGLKGEQGPQGLQGEKGEKGDTGLQGSQGVAGPMGPMGFMGPAGPTGAQGSKGDKGDTGDKGDKGDPGLNGADGKDGIDGQRGISKHERKKETFISIPMGTSLTYARCPDGLKLLGGGGGFTEDIFNRSQPIPITMIYNGPDPTGKEEWNIIWYNAKESDIEKVIIEVFAICADVSQ